MTDAGARHQRMGSSCQRGSKARRLGRRLGQAVEGGTGESLESRKQRVRGGQDAKGGKSVVHLRLSIALLQQGKIKMTYRPGVDVIFVHCMPYSSLRTIQVLPAVLVHVHSNIVILIV